MKEASFYHLSLEPKYKILPRLLEKIIPTGKRVLLFFVDPIKMKEYDDLLWSYTTKFFMPHAINTDKFPEEQPILLSNEITLINKAEIFINIDGNLPEDLTAFNKILFLFDENEAGDLEKLKKLWYDLKAKNYSLNYFKQQLAGGWDKSTELPL